MLAYLVDMPFSCTVIDIQVAVFVLVFGGCSTANSHGDALVTSRSGIGSKVHVVVSNADSALAYGPGCLGAVSLAVVENPTVRQDHSCSVWVNLCGAGNLLVTVVTPNCSVSESHLQSSVFISICCKVGWPADRALPASDLACLPA